MSQTEVQLIKDAVSTLEENNYEYITIDKRPLKDATFKGMNYFADCYWFLCRKDFYTKHNIWVDWCRGDNNHLATIFFSKDLTNPLSELCDKYGSDKGELNNFQQHLKKLLLV